MLRINMIILVVLSVACYSLAGSIRGTVRNSIDLTPLQNADVTVHVLIPDSIPYPTVTDLNGDYSISDIVPNNEIYVVIGYKYGFKQSYTRVDDLGSQDLLFDIFLEPDTVNKPPEGGDSSFVAGYIMEPVFGGILSPVGNAAIFLYSSAGDASTWSDNEGKYKVKVPAGSYVITVVASGFDSLSTTDVTVDTIGITVNAILQRNTLSADDEKVNIPKSFGLSPPYPNPFNPITKIEYKLPFESRVKLTVYNLLGQTVKTLVDQNETAGYKTVRWDAGDVSSGIYFYCIEVMDKKSSERLFMEAKKVILIR